MCVGPAFATPHFLRSPFRASTSRFASPFIDFAHQISPPSAPLAAICDNRHISQKPMASGSRPPALSRFGLRRCRLHFPDCFVAAGCALPVCCCERRKRPNELPPHSFCQLHFPALRPSPPSFQPFSLTGLPSTFLQLCPKPRFPAIGPSPHA
jgi:hypothetical protein